MNKKVCAFFNTTNGCTKGNSCQYLHQKLQKKQVCFFYTSPKGCLKGDSCQFLHEETKTTEKTIEKKTNEKIKREKKEIKLIKSPYPLVDIGINLTNRRYKNDLKQVLKRSFETNVKHLIITGTDEVNSNLALEFCEKKFEGVNLYFTVGVHPHEAKTCNDKTIENLRIMSMHKKCVAIGECGLDFDRNFSKKEDQEFWFEEQLKLAEKLKKPVFLHERDAFDSFSKIVSKYNVKMCVHCFTGKEEELDYYIKKGYYIGITGFICKKERGKELRKFISKIPLNRLMIETDGPFMAPVEDLKRNEPCYLPFVLKEIAKIYEMDEEKLGKSITKTTFEFFNIKE
eukprot:gene4689-8261_t